MEIEKKFSIKTLPSNLEQFECIHIEQGYLCRGPIVRIRKANEDYILTYKSKTKLNEEKFGTRISNEVELPLSEQAYNHLKEKIDGSLIVKDRYKIPYEDGRTIELDIFHGYLEGLRFAEVEFDSVEQIQEFSVPDWFEEDVSMDTRYSNSYLSSIDRWVD